MEEDLQSVLDIMYQPRSLDEDSNTLDYLVGNILDYFVGIYWII